MMGTIGAIVLIDRRVGLVWFVALDSLMDKACILSIGGQCVSFEGGSFSIKPVQRDVVPLVGNSKGSVVALDFARYGVGCTEEFHKPAKTIRRLGKPEVRAEELSWAQSSQKGVVNELTSNSSAIQIGSP